jgi:hypothetical protein
MVRLRRFADMKKDRVMEREERESEEGETRQMNVSPPTTKVERRDD